MTHPDLQTALSTKSFTWLVTGVAGFIGSNLLEALLRANQNVVGLDNFSTGQRLNLEQVQNSVTSEQWERFKFIEGDIRKASDCANACVGVDYVLHQAALGSVPRSIDDPVTTNDVNISGFLNMMVAARDAQVKRFVYAASSSTYGDSKELPKVEDRIGKPLSPYAITKYVNELYADIFARHYGTQSIGLRYFNVFGPRQNPNGAYAAVIPKWISSLLNNESVFINGDGETSRDFCYVENVVQANLLAALTNNPDAINHVYNVALGDQTTLKSLYEAICDVLKKSLPNFEPTALQFRDFRSGDVRHSLADISKAKNLLSYAPSWRIRQGLEKAMPWYIDLLSVK